MESDSAFLTFETILKFPRIAEGQCFARPTKRPWSLRSGVSRLTAVMLFDPPQNIIGQTDIKLSHCVLDDVDAVKRRHSERRWLRGRDLTRGPGVAGL